MSRIFISYSRRDGTSVGLLAQKLEEAGHTIWLDRSAIQGGTQWQAEIVRGIDTADVFVILLSPQSVESENVEKELGLAHVRGKTILPVVIQPVTLPPRFASGLAGLEMIDIAAENLDAGSQRVIGAIASPDTRAGIVYLDASPRDKYLALYSYVVYVLTLSLFASSPYSRPILALIALVVIAVWASRKLFVYLRLRSSGVVLSTELKGISRVNGQSHCRIVSEWRDPRKGKRYRFYSKKIPFALAKFVERTIPVIGDPRNFRTYRMDLSLPIEPRGSLVLFAQGEAASGVHQNASGSEDPACHIFVSYSERDGERVALLIHKLEKAGHTVWSTSEADIEDLPYQDRVIDGIAGARLVLLVLSPHSVESDRVRRELDLAVAKGKRIIAAVLHRAPAAREMHYALVGAKHVDLSLNFEAGMDRLLDAMAQEAPREMVMAETAKATRAAWLRPKLRAVAIFALFIPAFSLMPFLLTVMVVCKILPVKLRPLRLASRLNGWFAIFAGEQRQSDPDLTYQGRLLITEYRSYMDDIEDGRRVGIRIVSQWRDPVSRQLYFFRSQSLACAPEQIKTRIIAVYVDPKNLRRYAMDLSFLPEDQRREVPKRASLLRRLHDRVRAGAPVVQETSSPAPSLHQTAEVAENTVFISYSDKDADHACLLIERIEAAGYEVVNRSEYKGSAWDEKELEKRISLARTFLLIVPSVASDLDSKVLELRNAHALKRQIIPVIFIDCEIPRSMQLALSGVQRIDLSQDIETGMRQLLSALGSRAHDRTREPRPPISKKRARRIFTGAVIGACFWGLGSLLSIFWLDRGPARYIFLRLAPLLGLVWGAAIGAILYRPRRGIRVLLLVAFPFVGVTLIILPLWASVYSPPRLSAATNAGSDNLALVLAPVFGAAAFIGGKRIQNRVFNYRLKKRGKLLLTEYKGFAAGIVSQWRDPRTDEVHTFVRKYRGNPSRAIRSNTIAVFVDPTDLSDYYMDLSYSPQSKD